MTLVSLFLSVVLSLSFLTFSSTPCDAAEPPRISHGDGPGAIDDSSLNDAILQEILQQNAGSHDSLSKDSAADLAQGNGQPGVLDDADFELDFGRNAGLAPDNRGAEAVDMEESPPASHDHIKSPVEDEETIIAERGQKEFPFPPPPQASALRQDKRAAASAAGTGDVSDTVFIAVTTVCSAAAVFGMVGAGVCWYRLHRRYKSAEEAEYGPRYGGKGGSKSGSPVGSGSGDGKMASNAHLYHYQHTKEQIIAMERSGVDAKGGAESEDSEGEEGEEADYSVYECPGLAPTGDIEVNNPLFENGPAGQSGGSFISKGSSSKDGPTTED